MSNTLQACGVEYVLPDDAVAEEIARGFERSNREANTRDWPALLAMLDRTDPPMRCKMIQRSWREGEAQRRRQVESAARRSERSHPQGRRSGP